MKDQTVMEEIVTVLNDFRTTRQAEKVSQSLENQARIQRIIDGFDRMHQGATLQTNAIEGLLEDLNSMELQQYGLSTDALTQMHLILLENSLIFLRLREIWKVLKVDPLPPGA